MTFKKSTKAPPVKQPKYRKHAIVFTEPSQTQQHQKDETDVNKIMRRYVKTGVIDHVNKNQPHYADVKYCDYHEALNQIQHAEDLFLELPAQARKGFENDPGLFLEYVQNPENVDKLYDMGLTNWPYNSPKSKQETEPETKPGKEASSDSE